MSHYGRSHFIIVVCAFLSLAGHARSRTSTYGGVSYSESTGQVSIGKSDSSFQGAYRQANRKCGASDCMTLVGVKGGWLAIYHSKFFKKYGVAAHLSKETAMTLAAERCQLAAGHACEVKTVTCSWEDCSKPNPHPIVPRKPKENIFAAMAFSTRTYSLGTANNVSPWKSAIEQALSDCGDEACMLVALSPFCVSYVTIEAFYDRQGIYRPKRFCHSNGDTAEDAEEYALGICEQFGSRARVEETICTRNEDR